VGQDQDGNVQVYDRFPDDELINISEVNQKKNYRTCKWQKMNGGTIIENILSFQKGIDIEVNERTNQKRGLSDQKKRFMPIQKILESESAC